MKEIKLVQSKYSLCLTVFIFPPPLASDLSETMFFFSSNIFLFGVREQYMVLCDMCPMSLVPINKKV